MSEELLRVCVVGAGALSTRRIYPYLGAAGAQLVGVCDLDLNKAERNARLFGGRPYSDARSMLDDLAPDACFICIGPEAHAQLAPEAMRRGIPVYTEKPPAPDLESALEVARVSRETGVLCSTAFKKRYATAYRRARQWVECFPPDQIMSIGVDYASAAYANESPRTSFLLDFGIHIIDLLQYLMGDAEEVFAFSRDGHAFAVSLRFTSGAVGSLNLTDGRSFTLPTEEVEITAAGGNWISVHNSSCWRVARDGMACEWREPPTFTSAGDSGNDTGHFAEIVEFLSAVREGRSTASDIFQSCRTMALYEAILQSVTDHTPVRPRYPAI